jgi:1-acyl-sn-glycerol-3-phosphate acyltransferase
MRTLFLGLVYKIGMRFFLQVIIGVKYYNRSVLKRKDQYILVSNHNSHLDTMAMMTAVPFRKLHKTHPVAAGDYFGNNKFKSLLTKLFVNGILVARSQEAKGEFGDTIEKLSKIIQEGNSIIIFPEGSRGEPEVMQRFKKGIGVLLKNNPTVAYVPVYTKGLGTVMPKGRFLFVPYESDIYFGEPAYAKGKEVEDIVLEIEEQILRLKEVFHEKHQNNELDEEKFK